MQACFHSYLQQRKRWSKVVGEGGAGCGWGRALYDISHGNLLHILLMHAASARRQACVELNLLRLGDQDLLRQLRKLHHML